MNGIDYRFREAEILAGGVRFRVWAPTAEAVQLLLYKQGKEGVPHDVEDLGKAEDGCWQVLVPLTAVGKFYQFRVRAGGVWRPPSPGLFAVAVGVNGQRAFVADWGKTDPEGWQEDAPLGFLHPADAVVYEMHHRDFSVSPDSGIFRRGKFLALAEGATRSPDGVRTGVSHLVELGVTHVHLLPSFDFASVDESRPDIPQYNWGYDPLNYNVPEGSYATDPFDPLCRIYEFKQMVMALHRAGLRVVLDVVYNHTYTVDGSNFERLVPGYFFRRKEDGTWADGSGCGNETASEREGMRRYMVESLCYWAREYHVDGFRFDVMGLHDLETMRQVRDALSRLNPSVLLYGEGWSSRPARIPAENCALKENMARLPGVAAFGDELRDGLRGEWTSATGGGFLAGLSGFAESVRFGIVGGVAHPQVDCSRVNHADRPWAGVPWQMVNYVSCHDDWCLADRLAAVCPDLPEGERLKLCKLALTILLTSQGIPLLFAGDEFFRSKHGVRNSYKSPDAVNAIVWSDKRRHGDLFRYVCGLIRLRRAHPAFRMRSADEVASKLAFLSSGSERLIAYTLCESGEIGREHFLHLFFNASPHVAQVHVSGPGCRVLCRDGEVSEEGLGVVPGGVLDVAPRSALIVEATGKARIVRLGKKGAVEMQ